MQKRLIWLVTVALLAVRAAAGPEWIEPKGEDAGSLPGGAQDTFGDGGLAAIKGQLNGVSPGPPDLQDMFVICIDDPAAFMATTVEFTGGFAEGFDSRLFLFRLDGVGLLGNDDTLLLDQIVVPESTLVEAADDGSGAIVTEPGLYLLAITLVPHAPISGGGPIFSFASPTEVSGPDGPGAEDEVSEWEQVVETGACCFSGGECKDDLTKAHCDKEGGDFQGEGTRCDEVECEEPEGACCLPDGECKDDPPQSFCEQVLGGVFQGPGTHCGEVDCPKPEGACLFPDGDCIITDKEKCDHEGGDYQGDGTTCPPPGVGPGEPGKPAPGEYRIVLSGTCFASPPPCPADVNGDGEVGIVDLMRLITHWGPCTPECPSDVNGDGTVDILDLVELIMAWGSC